MGGHHFISYSRPEALDFVSVLCDELEASSPDFRVWFDQRDGRPGEDWDEQIAEAIRTCESLVFVMTEDSVAPTSVCKREWTYALQCKRPITPLKRDAKAGLSLCLAAGRQTARPGYPGLAPWGRAPRAVACPSAATLGRVAGGRGARGRRGDGRLAWGAPPGAARAGLGGALHAPVGRYAAAPPGLVVAQSPWWVGASRHGPAPGLAARSHGRPCAGPPRVVMVCACWKRRRAVRRGARCAPPGPDGAVRLRCPPGASAKAPRAWGPWRLCLGASSGRAARGGCMRTVTKGSSRGAWRQPRSTVFASMLGLGLTPGPRPRRFWRPRAIAFQWSLARPLRRMISRWQIGGKRPHSGPRITRTARHCVPSRAPSTKRGPLLPRILIQCGGGVDATGKKAVWKSHKLHRFPKANLIIYMLRSKRKVYELRIPLCSMSPEFFNLLKRG